MTEQTEQPVKRVRIMKVKANKGCMRLSWVQFDPDDNTMKYHEVLVDKPYCPRCWEETQKEFRLIKTPLRTYQCMKCSTTYALVA